MNNRGRDSVKDNAYRQSRTFRDVQGLVIQSSKHCAVGLLSGSYPNIGTHLPQQRSKAFTNPAPTNYQHRTILQSDIQLTQSQLDGTVGGDVCVPGKILRVLQQIQCPICLKNLIPQIPTNHNHIRIEVCQTGCVFARHIQKKMGNCLVNSL